MASLIAHALLGVLTVWCIVRANPAIFRRAPDGQSMSSMELALYTAGVVSVILGWYFNIRFVVDEGPDKVLFNPIWGDGSWAQYIKLMFDNPAASSAGQDYTIGNVILLPVMTIVDGRRRGINRPWLYFVSSLFTSFAFAWAFYLASAERQRRVRLSYGTPAPATSAIAGHEDQQDARGEKQRDAQQEGDHVGLMSP
jgi:hypothetical protein